ncbi:AAA family ATPase [Dactylosporangium sp. CA-092794]|uniref:AAA family ATPase n=1 Tax=Dactylosporangium sp. CA-092794 TaxID=3239929 RepID=UPI003D8DF567
MTEPEEDVVERDWWIYRGTGSVPESGPAPFPEPPPWRTYDGAPPEGTGWATPPTPAEASRQRRLGRFSRGGSPVKLDPKMLDIVNSALLLRRPLLITGKAGTGKSTLAYSIATELDLGAVLYWPITSRSTLGDGLYQYDAIGRLQALSRANLATTAGQGEPANEETGVGRFLRLGPLGSALIPWQRPRVLLIDEIDKSDVDLPNDLLTIFEEAEFVITELARLADQPTAQVRLHDGSVTTVERGLVRCLQFPVVVLTSNGERDFPPAFLRRCIRLTMPQPDEQRLRDIVEAHLGADQLEAAVPHIHDFLAKLNQGDDLAADQLLNAVFLASGGQNNPHATEEAVREALRPLNRPVDD